MDSAHALNLYYTASYNKMRNINFLVGKPDLNTPTYTCETATMIKAIRGCYGIFMLGNPPPVISEMNGIELLFIKCFKKKNQVLSVTPRGKLGCGVEDLGDDFALARSTENSDLEGLLPIRGMDHLHHSRCLLINPFDGTLTTSCNTRCLH